MKGRKDKRFSMMRSTVIALLGAGLGLAGPATSAWADMSLDVSPIRVQVRVNAGDEYTNALRVLNSGQEPIRLRAYVEDWTLDEVGTPVFRTAGTETRSASIWMEAAPADFLLEPGETKFVRFTARVPDGIPDGGYHSSLLLESLPLDRTQEGVMRMFVQGRVACMIYVTVGNPRRAAEITSLTPIRRGDKHYVRLTVANTGDDTVRLAGDLKLFEGMDPRGEAVPLPDVPVLPGGRRRVDLEVPVEFAARVMARLTIDIDGVGVLLGECSLDPEKVQLVKE